MRPGHTACPGCAAATAMKMAMGALGPRTMVVLAASCMSSIAGAHPYTSLGVPVVHTAFAAAASTATGLKRALEARGEKDVTVMALAGDGGTFDIGLQALSGAAERNEDILYVCYDNEAYMNTGVQRSSATPYMAWTTTTGVRRPKDVQKKRILDIMAAHRIPYAASANPAFPEDLQRKFRAARKIGGMRFIHLLTPCPTGWKFPPSQSMKLARLAVHANVFPLLESFGGGPFRITAPSRGLPVREYLARQERFSHLGPREVETLQKIVDEEWEALRAKSPA